MQEKLSKIWSGNTRKEIHQKTLPFYKKQKKKKKYQDLTEMSKLSSHKKQTEYFNQSRDATQFWHKSENFIGRVTNNTVEPMFDRNSSTYIKMLHRPFFLWWNKCMKQ